MKTNIHFWSYLAQFLLEWEMFHKGCVEKKTKLLFNNASKKNRAVSEMRKNTQLDRPQMKIWRMSIACCILTLQTHTHNM